MAAAIGPLHPHPAGVLADGDDGVALLHDRFAQVLGQALGHLAHAAVDQPTFRVFFLGCHGLGPGQVQDRALRRIKAP